MAKYFQVRLISKAIELPTGLVSKMGGVMKTYVGKQKNADKLEIKIPTGLDGLNPKDRILRAVNEIPLKAGVPCHSIIGNKKEATPGGSDGVVEYSSSHLDEVRSELVVQSGHSVQTHPVAIYEVRRILLEHLKDEKIIAAEQGKSPASGSFRDAEQ